VTHIPAMAIIHRGEASVLLRTIGRDNHIGAEAGLAFKNV
jgi:hypothetical protein